MVKAVTVRRRDGGTHVLRLWYRVLPRQGVQEVLKRAAGKGAGATPDRGLDAVSVYYATVGSSTETERVVFAHYMDALVHRPADYIGVAWAAQASPAVVVLDGVYGQPPRRRLSHYILDLNAPLVPGKPTWGREGASLSTRPVASKVRGSVVLGRLNHSWTDVHALPVKGGTLVSLAAGKPMGHILVRFDAATGDARRVQLQTEGE